MIFMGKIGKNGIKKVQRFQSNIGVTFHIEHDMASNKIIKNNKDKDEEIKKLHVYDQKIGDITIVSLYKLIRYKNIIVYKISD